MKSHNKIESESKNIHTLKWNKRKIEEKSSESSIKNIGMV